MPRPYFRTKRAAMARYAELVERPDIYVVDVAAIVATTD